MRGQVCQRESWSWDWPLLRQLPSASATWRHRCEMLVLFLVLLYNPNEALYAVAPYPEITRGRVRGLVSWVWPLSTRLPSVSAMWHHRCEMLVLYLMLLCGIMLGGDEWRVLLLVLLHGVMADIIYVFVIEGLGGRNKWRVCCNTGLY